MVGDQDHSRAVQGVGPSSRYGFRRLRTAHQHFRRSRRVHSAVVAEWESQLEGQGLGAAVLVRALRCRGGVGVSIASRRRPTPQRPAVHSAVVAEWESQWDCRVCRSNRPAGVHSAVVAEWESQYLQLAVDGGGHNVHSAVVAEWESQSVSRRAYAAVYGSALRCRGGVGVSIPPSAVDIRCRRKCTPLSWRSGSLNPKSQLVALSRANRCTPLSWRSGSLNSSM